MTRTLPLALALTLGLSAAAPQALCDELVAEVVVQEGDTLRSLAGRLYGRVEIAELLSRAGFPDNPQAGTRLKIPLAQEIVMPGGSSLSSLAKKHFHDGARWPILAAFSGIPDARRCVAGTTVLLPARLRLRVRSGDSLGKLASMAWGTARGGSLIARWNGLPPAAWLTRGAWIEIPLPGPLAVTSDVKAARDSEPPLIVSKPQRPASVAAAVEDPLIARLRERRRRGDPAGLLMLAETVLKRPVLPPKTRSYAARQAAHALLALGRKEAAEAVLREQITPGQEPDPVMDSPKLRRIWPTNEKQGRR